MSEGREESLEGRAGRLHVKGAVKSYVTDGTSAQGELDDVQGCRWSCGGRECERVGEE
jgi:hypothetical protein